MGLGLGGGQASFIPKNPHAHKSEVNKRGRPSKWPPECLPSKFADFECAFSLSFLGANLTPKDPFLLWTFWDNFLAADSLPGAFVHSRIKIKLALPPPFQKKHDPPSNEEFYGHRGFPAERTKKCQAPTKIGAAISGPRIAGGKITDMSPFASFNQILTRFHGIRLKSGRNLLKSCVFRGPGRAPTGLKR